MPKRCNSSTNVHRRSRRRLRLIPPTTYHGSGTPENPIVINDTEHTGEAIDLGLVPIQPPLIPSTEPSQADLDESCIYVSEHSTSYQLPYIIRNVVNNYWLGDADPVPQECIPSLTAALIAVRDAKDVMEIAKAKRQAEGNYIGGVKLRRIPSDLTSITIASQDSARSGGTEEYKLEELEDIMVQEVTKPAELEVVTDDDVV